VTSALRDQRMRIAEHTGRCALPSLPGPAECRYVEFRQSRRVVIDLVPLRVPADAAAPAAWRTPLRAVCRRTMVNCPSSGSLPLDANWLTSCSSTRNAPRSREPPSVTFATEMMLSLCRLLLRAVRDDEDRDVPRVLVAPVPGGFVHPAADDDRAGPRHRPDQELERLASPESFSGRD